jgi:hypothetical protein
MAKFRVTMQLTTEHTIEAPDETAVRAAVQTLLEDAAPLDIPGVSVLEDDVLAHGITAFETLEF